MSIVTDIPTASPEVAQEHFRRRLSLETDCADVHEAMSAEGPDFVLLHVIGSREAFERCRIPGAFHLPHREISEERMAEWPLDTLFVVYCAGPHCNGADKAALKIAKLGRPVKIMIGGIAGWADEGYEFTDGPTRVCASA